MRLELYGLSFVTPQVTFYLWSPWRCALLEHKLFEAVRQIPGVKAETQPDEWRLHVEDSRTARLAFQTAERVLKGWQEEAEQGSERRYWHWMFEGDTDANGYDHTGAPASLWGFLRCSLDRAGVGEGEKPEEVDLEGFGFEILPTDRLAPSGGE
jgi:hypothetical protein